MPRKWIGAAAWSAKEAKVGDRLPYARLIDENTLLLRDGQEVPVSHRRRQEVIEALGRRSGQPKA